MAKRCALGKRHALYDQPPISSLKRLLVMAANRSQRTFCSARSAASFQKQMLRTLRHIQSRYLKSHCSELVIHTQVAFLNCESPLGNMRYVITLTMRLMLFIAHG